VQHHLGKSRSTTEWIKACPFCRIFSLLITANYLHVKQLLFGAQTLQSEITSRCSVVQEFLTRDRSTLSLRANQVFRPMVEGLVPRKSVIF